MKPSEAYCMGKQDYEQGLDLTRDNPFSFLSCDWHDWQSGFCDAANEHAEWFDPADEEY